MRATLSVYKEHCPDAAFCAFGLFPCLFIWKQQQQQSNKEKQEVHVFISPNNDEQIIVNEFF